MAKFYDSNVYPLKDTLDGSEIFTIFSGDITNTTTIDHVTGFIYNNTTIQDISNVDVTNASDGQILIYQSGQWVNGDGSFYDQDLNTTDSPTFVGITITDKLNDFLTLTKVAGESKINVEDNYDAEFDSFVFQLRKNSSTTSAFSRVLLNVDTDEYALIQARVETAAGDVWSSGMGGAYISIQGNSSGNPFAILTSLDPFTGEYVLKTDNVMPGANKILSVYNGRSTEIFSVDGDGKLYGDGSQLTNLPSGNPFDQDLNTTNTPTFAGLGVSGDVNITGQYLINGDSQEAKWVVRFNETYFQATANWTWNGSAWVGSIHPPGDLSINGGETSWNFPYRPIKVKVTASSSPDGEVPTFTLRTNNTYVIATGNADGTEYDIDWTVASQFDYIQLFEFSYADTNETQYTITDIQFLNDGYVLYSEVPSTSVPRNVSNIVANGSEGGVFPLPSSVKNINSVDVWVNGIKLVRSQEFTLNGGGPNYSFLTISNPTILLNDDIEIITSGAAVEVVGSSNTNIKTFQAGEALSLGDVCYFSSDGKMYKANSNSAVTSSGLAGMALSAAALNDTISFMLDGEVSGFTGLTVGDILYISSTSGLFTNVAPTTSGHIVRVIGYSLTTTDILFDPSKTWIELV